MAWNYLRCANCNSFIPFSFRLWCYCTSSVRHWQDRHICHLHLAAVGYRPEGDPGFGSGTHQRAGSAGMLYLRSLTLKCFRPRRHIWKISKDQGTTRNHFLLTSVTGCAKTLVHFCCFPFCVWRIAGSNTNNRFSGLTLCICKVPLCFCVLLLECEMMVTIFRDWLTWW